ncbi:MAG TPA: DUF460 domain-containing protein [Candidatus Acidoferrum sp.]|nr:DUF460 domain-containing protein [Candidatus Acidoferrum sp.]
MAHIIVGVDPGKTSAIACLSLDGKLLHHSHMVNAGLSWMLENIRMVGTPSIIATDRRVVGQAIKKINAAFNARIYHPERDIPVSEKRELGRSVRIKDPHERDAYSAAFKAYHMYANKLNQAEHISREKSVDDTDRIKAKIIDRYSISEAISGSKANRP